MSQTKIAKRRRSNFTSRRMKDLSQNKSRINQTSQSRFRKGTFVNKHGFNAYADRNQEAFYNLCYKKLFGARELTIHGKYSVTNGRYENVVYYVGLQIQQVKNL